MIKTGQAAKKPTYNPKIVVVKPRKGCVYRIMCENKKDAELCVSMHEAKGDRAFILNDDEVAVDNNKHK